MKALKEKRISLRSLWRRGLVILSLFALVFASCGDSSSSSDDGGGSSSGGRVVGVKFLTDKLDDDEVYKISGFQHMGQEVNLAGVYVEVYYSDRAKPEVVKYEQAPTSFSSYPRVATGYWDVGQVGSEKNPSGFIGMPNVRVSYDAGGGFIWHDVLPFKYPPIGIKREDTKTAVTDPISGQGDPDVNTREEVFSGGVHLTGILKNDYAFADDDHFEFEGLSLWADYDDGIQRPLKFENVRWEVLPDYNRDERGLPRDTDDDQTYRGYLYITVGEDISKRDTGESWTGGNLTQAKWAGGITVRKAINHVYTVFDKDTGIEWVETPKLDDFFFWQENTSKAWTDRLIAADAKIRVHYRGTKETKELLIKDLAGQQDFIYWNANIADEDFDNGVKPIAYTYVAKNAPAGYAANPNPKIVVYYRGGRVELPIDVYSTFRSLVVTNTLGEEISFEDYEDKYDNDVPAPIGFNEKQFTDLLTVTVTYRAYNDTSKEAPFELKPWFSTLGDGIYGTNWGYGYSPKPTMQKDVKPETPVIPIINKWNTGEYYTTDFVVVQAAAKADFQAKAKPKAVKKNVSVRYYALSDDTEAALGVQLTPLAPRPLFGETKDVTKKGVNGVTKKVKVTWNE